MKIKFNPILVFACLTISVSASAEMAIDRTMDGNDSAGTSCEKSNGDEIDLVTKEYNSYCSGAKKESATPECIAIKSAELEEKASKENAAANLEMPSPKYFARKAKAACEEFCVEGYDKKMNNLATTCSGDGKKITAEGDMNILGKNRSPAGGISNEKADALKAKAEEFNATNDSLNDAYLSQDRAVKGE